MPGRPHKKNERLRINLKRVNVEAHAQRKATRIQKPKLPQEQFLSRVQLLIHQENISQAQATKRVSEKYELEF